MNRNFIKNILLFILFFLQLNANGAELSYKDILDTAINNSFDLKMSTLDIGISKSQLKSVRADWYPTLSLQFNTEYNKDLTGGNGNYAYAGNTMITPYTQFRDMMYLTLSYNLIDYGIQGKKVHIAKQELAQKEAAYNIQLKELKLKILNLYSEAQQYNNTIAIKNEILKLYKQMFVNKERIYKSGLNNKLSVMDEAIKIAKAQNELENSKLDLTKILEDLSYYTKTSYDMNNISFKSIESYEEGSNHIFEIGVDDIIKTEIQQNDIVFVYHPEETEEAKYYDLEIEKKKAELSILKRQQLPIFKFYTGYSLYGQNPHNYFDAIQDIGQRSLVFGISSQFMIFDGFKNKTSREKTNLEIEKLKLEKEKKISELENQYNKTFKTYQAYNNELDINKKLLIEVKDKLNAVNRLNSNLLIEKNELLGAKADLLTQECEIEKNIINLTAKIEEMKILTGEDL